MAERMIADYVPCTRNFTHNIQPVLDISPNQKKSSPHVTPSKNFQQAQSMRIIRAVIISEREQLGPTSKPGKRAPIPLPGGPHRLIAAGHGSCSGRSGQHRSKHAAIVMERSAPERRHPERSRFSGGVRDLPPTIARARKILPTTQSPIALLTLPSIVTRPQPGYPAISETSRAPMANLFELPRYIAVEGPIRVGKSTLARILAERLNAQRVMEPEANPFLSAFYEGERGAAFQAQFAFLVARFEQLQALDLGRRSQKTVVADYIIEKDKLFACLNLTDQELDTYNRYYNHFREQLPTPDLVIYLQATPEVLKKRLRKKNAPGERSVSDEYLEEVVKAYEHFFFHYTSSDLLIVNTSDIDFVDRNEDLQELLRKVTEPIKGTQYFLPLGGQEAVGA